MNDLHHADGFDGADMVLLPRIGLEPGEKRELEMIGIGFAAWRPQPIVATVERLDDTTYEGEEGDAKREIPVTAYRMTAEIEVVGEIVSTMLIDEAGVLRSSTTEMAMGTTSATYIAETGE